MRIITDENDQEHLVPDTGVDPELFRTNIVNCIQNNGVPTNIIYPDLSVFGKKEVDSGAN